MNDLKNIPKMNAKRRDMMKGAAATAGVAAIYTAPAIQRIAVSVAQAAGSTQLGKCYKFSVGGQFDGTFASNGGAKAITTQVGIALLSDDSTQTSGIIWCCTSSSCSPPSGDNLQITWQDANGTNTFHLTSVTSASCDISCPECSDVPLPSPNTLTLSGAGTYNLAKSGATGTATVFAVFGDKGEGGTNDTTSITLTLDTGQVLTASATSLQNGNYQVLPGQSC